jgi:hypothetical protein
MDLTSDQVGGLLHITGAALRMIELELRPASDRLIARAARLYRIDKGALMKDDKPADKPEKPSRVDPKIEPTGPPARRNGKDNRRAPQRAANQAGAA